VDLPPSPDAAFNAAYLTLLRGAEFVAAGLRSPAARTCARGAGSDGERYRARLIGNALRELDRFLNLLADETSRLLDVRISPGQRNTANKLRDIDELCLCYADHSRLRALGRARELLYRRDGRLGRGDRAEVWSLAASWPGDDARRGSPGRTTRLLVIDDDLARIGALYRRLAKALAGVAGSVRTPASTCPVAAPSAPRTAGLRGATGDGVAAQAPDKCGERPVLQPVA
jgi:hypothetical protein